MRPIFALIRVLGNETQPRDSPGGRLRSLEHLVMEPSFCGVVKAWVINRVWDLKLVAAYHKVLDGPARQGHVFDLPFEPVTYFKLGSYKEKLAYCPGINQARNEGLRIAFKEYDAHFAAVFDGGCGFTRAQWETVSSEIFSDYLSGAGRRTYSIPMIRLNCEEWNKALALPAQPIPDRVDEPQLIISRRAWDQGIRYDESRGPNDEDKLELLFRLGHNRQIGHWHELVRDDQCRSVGRCCHVNTGTDETERELSRLWNARQQGIPNLHADIMRQYKGEEPYGPV